MNLVFVFIFLLCVATVNAFMTAKSPGIPRGSHLFGKLHDAAEVGDLETVKEIIGGDPKLVSKYDIDGQVMKYLCYERTSLCIYSKGIHS